MNIQQLVLKNKFQAYLAKMSQKYPKKYNPADVKEIIDTLTLGHCSGFTSLWFYRKSKGQDSLFYGNLNLISEWDETSESLWPSKEDIEAYKVKLDAAIKNKKMHPKEADEKLEQFKEKGSFIAQVFERTLNDIRWMQNSLGTMQSFNKGRRSRTVAEAIQRQTKPRKAIKQTDMDDTFEGIKEKSSASLTKEFSMGFIFKKSELITTLKNVVLEDKMIQIGSTNHVIGVIKTEGKYHLYDSNNKEGEKIFSTIEELEAEIEECHFRRFGIRDENLPININIFDWEKDDPDYRSPYSPYLSVDLISSFLQANNQINRTSWDNFTPLTLALAWDYAPIYNFLISKGANINQPDPKGRTPLIVAVRENNIALLNYLCLQKNINLNQDVNGWTALMFAAHDGNIKSITTLLNQPGINVNFTDPKGATALGLAVFHNHLEAVKLLISAPNIQVDYKTIMAIKNQETATLISKHLIKEFKNYPLNKQEALLKGAFQGGNTQLLYVLLSTRPHLFQYSVDTRMEILLFLTKHNMENKSLSQFVQSLRENPFMDINAKNLTGHTAIGLAAQRNLIPIVNVLISFPNLHLDYDTLRAPVQMEVFEIYRNHLNKHFKDYPLPNKIRLFDAAFAKNDTPFVNFLLSQETQYAQYPKDLRTKIAMATLDLCKQTNNYSKIKEFFRKYPKTFKACLPGLEHSVFNATKDKNKSLLNFLLNDLKIVNNRMSDVSDDSPRSSKKFKTK